MVIFWITNKLSVRTKKRRSNVNRADELRRKIRRVPSCNSNAVNKAIYVQKVYTVNLGIKYMEAI